MTDSTYHVLRINLADKEVRRCVYIKEHDASTENGAAAFVAGIPVKLRNRLNDVFGHFGDVDQIQVHPRQTSAIVFFQKSRGLKKLLAAAKTGFPIDIECADTSEGNGGLRQYVEDHKAQYPGNENLREGLDAWMAAYEEEQEQKRKLAEAADDDGWTVVTRKPGRKRKQGMTVSGGIALAAAEARAAKKKPRAATDFYRFQAKEKKRNEMLELRKEFADAKMQLQAIRSARKFSG